MIISLHLPKTAGSSFAKSLEGHFENKLLKDYKDLPLNTVEYKRNKDALEASIYNAESAKFTGVECIHGHFLPLKYLLLNVQQELTFITWMRNPVERVLSHYYFWKRTYNPSSSPKLHRRVIEEEWTIEKFCLSKELRNLYKQFLWGFPLENFDFIGIVEFYNQDFKYFCRKYLNVELEEQKENIGDSNTKKYQIDDEFYEKIKNFHKDDMVLYERALEKRLKRL